MVLGVFGRSGPYVRGVCQLSCFLGGGQLGADPGEKIGQPGTEERDGDDDGDSDQADHEAVLDGGRSSVRALSPPVPEQKEQRSDVCRDGRHGILPVLMRPPRGSTDDTGRYSSAVVSD